jgi:hypothetical protein
MISCVIRPVLPVCLLALLMASVCFGQESSQPSGLQPKNTAEPAKPETSLQKVRDLPIEWLIGPYIPSSEPLQPLTNGQRQEVYIHQTFLTAGVYVERMFTAGIDQARGTPSQWGGGMAGYGRRFGSRYGRFVISNTFDSVGNAALGYESRYDLCHCTGFWPRTRHAIARNFVTYNRTERELRPAIPLYAGAFGAGMVSSVWLPGHRNVWKEGGYEALEQAGWGSAYNWVSEFAIDILHKLTNKRYPKGR